MICVTANKGSRCRHSDTCSECSVVRKACTISVYRSRQFLLRGPSGFLQRVYAHLHEIGTWSVVVGRSLARRDSRSALLVDMAARSTRCQVKVSPVTLDKNQHVEAVVGVLDAGEIQEKRTRGRQRTIAPAYGVATLAGPYSVFTVSRA